MSGVVQARRLQCTHHVRVNPMERLTRLVGGVLLAIGAVVAVHTIIEPLYHVSSAASPYSPMWRIIDPLEALAVVLGVIGGYLRTRSVAHDGAAPITRECLAAHALFYEFLTQMCARFSPSRSAAPWEEGADALVPANQR